MLDELVVTRRILESDMAHVAARQADEETVEQLERLVAAMDNLVDDPAAYAVQDRAFHDTVMRASGNRDRPVGGQGSGEPGGEHRPISR